MRTLFVFLLLFISNISVAEMSKPSGFSANLKTLAIGYDRGLGVGIKTPHIGENSSLALDYALLYGTSTFTYSLVQLSTIYHFPGSEHVIPYMKTGYFFSFPSGDSGLGRKGGVSCALGFSLPIPASPITVRGEGAWYMPVASSQMSPFAQGAGFSMSFDYRF